ncbi:hypothetical protein TNCV_3585421 [Trichonephila clavipes]|nr:hypothetical protein TNCV_3585421 [Trichonephila clavipes]
MKRKEKNEAPLPKSILGCPPRKQTNAEKVDRRKKESQKLASLRKWIVPSLGNPWPGPPACLSSCASASISNAKELDEQILEVKINPQEKNTVSDTSTNKDTLSKEKESENENEETKLIRNDFAHYVGTPIDADLRE